jgi:hypothetical protein
MECQYKIADQIVVAGADYLFALKENQGPRYEDVKTYFEGFDQTRLSPFIQPLTWTTAGLRGGFMGLPLTAWLIKRHPAWKSIKSIGVIDSTREIEYKVSLDGRFYGSSLPADPQVFAVAGRGTGG